MVSLRIVSERVVEEKWTESFKKGMEKKGKKGERKGWNCEVNPRKLEKKKEVDKLHMTWRSVDQPRKPNIRTLQTRESIRQTRNLRRDCRYECDQ